jgi:cysteinyl-tRNA synthetase
MIKDLEEQKSEDSSSEANKLAETILPVFEAAMDNDLDVKTAFDNLYETISEIHSRRETLNRKSIKNVMNNLRRIDSVFQCIF